MKPFEKLLLENKAWATEKTAREPEYFRRLAEAQTPDVLWIGCSDSRVPAEIIVNAEPGEIFVHRNIANQVIMTDFNGLSVLQYAVDVLKVNHVVVCGHYNCGGIKAALDRQHSELAITNKWLMHIKDIYRFFQKELENLETSEQRVNRLVELNIVEQVHKLSHTSIVQQAWAREQRPILHGWVYGLNDGIIEELVSLRFDQLLDPIYQYVDPPAH